MTDITNTDLAQRISALVDRWNTRENQMILLLTQESGSVTVTDGVGSDHVLPSFPQLQADVTAMTDVLTGAVAQAQDVNSASAAMLAEATSAASSATASATAAAASASSAAEQVSVAVASATEAANASATSAASSATSAASSASTATSAAAAASSSATAAASSASTASSAATGASSSASAASSSASAAGASKTAAQAAAGLADQYANAPVDTQVSPGHYSAFHWSKKAQEATTGTLVYMGTWDASSGAYPASPAKGHFYKVTTAGTYGGYDYSVGDQIIYNGADWDIVDNSDQVTTVAGKSGAVVLVKADVGLGNVDNTSDANKPISTATQSALNGKQNALGYTPVNKAGDTMTGALTTPSFIANNSSASWGIVFNTAGTGIGGIWNDGTSIALLNINGGLDRSSIALKADTTINFHSSTTYFDGAVNSSSGFTGQYLTVSGSTGLDYQLSGNRLMIRSDSGSVSIDAVNPANSAFDVLRLRGSSLLFNGQQVWSAGNFNPSAKQDALGFNPVQQGTGIGQSGNIVRIGWSNDTQLKATVDSTDLGNFWLSSNFNPDSKASLAGANFFTDQNPIIMVNGGNQVNQFNVGDRTGWYDVAGSKDIWFYKFATKWLTLNGNVTANGTLTTNQVFITGLGDGFFSNGTGVQYNGQLYLGMRPNVINATANGWVTNPRIFVQAGDPGNGAADGDLWIW